MDRSGQKLKIAVKICHTIVAHSSVRQKCDKKM